jgi:hypothetical protein
MRYKRPDKKNALSIIESAKREMDFTLSLELNEKSASTIIKNIYECFRMLGDALLVSRGIESQDHIEPIKEIINFNVKLPRHLGVIGNLRGLRHNINYYGYRPNLEEAKDIVSLAKSCFYLLLDAVSKKVNNS